MYISRYIVTQDYNGEKLLFSTLTTAIVSLENDIYTSIFENREFEKHGQLVEQLRGMGFIHDDSFDEFRQLEDIRKFAYDKNNEQTLYYMITPTLACNARCYYCFEKEVHHKTMSAQVARNVADFIVANRGQKEILIQWFGGEPLLAPDVIDLISDRLIAEGMEFSAKITTNGYLLDDATMKKATSKWKVKTIQVTIDGLEEEYNRIKNYVYEKGESPFRVVLRNIRNALSYDIFMRIRINVDLRNIQQAQNIIAFLKKEFAAYPNCGVYFAPINESEDVMPAISDTFSGASEHPLLTMLNFEEGYAGLGQSRLFIAEQPTTWSEILMKYYIHPIPVSCFGSCKCSLSIDSKGDIYICHRYFGRGEQYSSGNVTTGMLDNDITLRFRDYRVPASCEKCNLLPICQGGCRYNREAYGEGQACVPSKGAIKQLIVRAVEEMNQLAAQKNGV